MPGESNRCGRWLMLVTSGAFLVQVPGCTEALAVAQTGLLAALTGITFWLARSV